MNNKFDHLIKEIAQSVTRCGALKKFGLGLALLVGLSGIASAVDTPDRSPGRIAVTGASDWSIVPAALAPPFVVVGTDGEFYVRHLPLVGKLSLAGRDVSIEGKISADFNAELDSTFSGPVWAPVTITGTINGSKTLLFEGNATGTTVGLVSVGTIKLDGRGPYEGSKLEFEFTENGPGNTDTYTLKGALIPGPAH
jgi:hypothetical protein